MQNNLIEATLNYPKGEFRFDFARNYINTLCECDWILHLDTDERLLIHQHDLLLTMLKNLGSDYWGINTGIYNNYNFKANDGFRKKTFENVTKIFRNNGIIKYEYPIHESVCNSIYANNKKIYDSNLCLHHIGYEIPIEKLIEKFERNIQLIWQYKHLSNNPIFQSYLEKSFISINQLRNYNNG